MDISKAVPKGYHFAEPHTHDGFTWKFEWRDRWSIRPVQYYFIDFGLSCQYPPGLTDIKDSGIYGQDKTVPEFAHTAPYDPFKLDIYQLGNVIVKVSQVSHPTPAHGSAHSICRRNIRASNLSSSLGKV